MDLKRVVENASQFLLQHGEHQPTLLLSGEGIEASVVIQLDSFPGTPNAREHALFTAGNLFAELEPRANIEKVWFVNEAWMSPPQQADSRVAASEHPQRREVLLVHELNAMTLAQQAEVLLIKRDENQQIQSTEALDVQTPLGVLVLAFLAGFLNKAKIPQREERSEKVFWEMFRIRCLMGEFSS
jgi:hypothetical protein